MAFTTTTEESNPCLIVGGTTTSDNSVLTVSTNTLESLQLSYGDIVLVARDKSRSTVLLLFVDESVDEDSVSMSDVVRHNLGIDTGDRVTVCACPEIGFADRVFVIAHIESFEDWTGLLFDDFLVPYFSESYRPIQKGDGFTCRAETKEISFEVIDVQPSLRAIVGQHTVLHLSINRPTYAPPLSTKFRTYFGKYKDWYSHLQQIDHYGRMFMRKFRGTLWQRRDRRQEFDSSSVECLIDESGSVCVMIQEKDAIDPSQLD